jgi:CRP/FNR family transcriptional regulator
MRTKREALAAVPMFEGLASGVLDRLLEHCVERTFARGETVFVEGQSSRGLLVILRGLLKVYKLGEGGREQILEIEGPGRSVAELPLFDGLPYPASCAALEDTVLLVIPPERFRQLVGAEANLAHAVIRSLSRRMRQMVGLVEEISLKAVRVRLAGLLLEMAGDGTEVQLTLTHQEIAARIGTVREIVSRTLNRMVREGAIAVDGRTVSLLDRSLLGADTNVEP